MMREPLTDVAEAVADGRPVSWQTLELQTTDEQGALLRQLRVLEQIASVQASLAAADEPAFHVWGPLKIIRKIGRGTHGEVFLARDPHLDRAVALKIISQREAADATDGDVIEEARLLARVRHPNVVTVYGAERILGRTGIWMEYIDGRTLEQELRDRGPFSPREIIAVAAAIGEAVAAVHAAGLLHRDIKTQNVMRDASGRLVLTDFGTGRERNDFCGRELAGTPMYLAPELLAGAPASAATDVYALGVLLYHLATGSFPVSGRSLGDLSDAHTRNARRTFAAARPGFPPAISALIDRATQPDPVQRFGSAAAMLEAVRGSQVRASSRSRVTAVVVPFALVVMVCVALARTAGFPPSRAREYTIEQQATTSSPAALQLFRLGMRALYAENRPQAVRVLTQAVQEDPSFATGHIYLAWCLRSTSGDRDYMSEARTAVALGDRTAEPERLFILASYYDMAGDDQKALSNYELLVSRYPTHYWGTQNLFDKFWELGRTSDAAKLASGLVTLDPQNFRLNASVAGALSWNDGTDAARPFVQRALALADSPSADPALSNGLRSWVLLFPVHELWIKGRVREAAALLDSLATRQDMAADADFETQLLVGFRLALGQTASAERLAQAISESAYRPLFLGMAALARNDTSQAAQQFRQYGAETDPAAVDLLILARDVRAATEVRADLERRQSLPAPRTRYTADEIAALAGDEHVIQRVFESPVSAMPAVGCDAFVYAETFARAALDRGEIDTAIRLLKRAVTLRDRSYETLTHIGYYSLRTQMLLADAYRRAGRIGDARHVEADLRARLAVADPDFPILVDLNKREAGDRAYSGSHD